MNTLMLDVFSLSRPALRATLSLQRPGKYNPRVRSLISSMLAEPKIADKPRPMRTCAPFRPHREPSKAPRWRGSQQLLGRNVESGPSFLSQNPQGAADTGERETTCGYDPTTVLAGVGVGGVAVIIDRSGQPTFSSATIPCETSSSGPTLLFPMRSGGRETREL